MLLLSQLLKLLLLLLLSSELLLDPAITTDLCHISKLCNKAEVGWSGGAGVVGWGGVG